MYRITVIFFLTLLLSSCLSPVKQTQTNNYVLNTLPHSLAVKQPSLPLTLLITPTTTRPIYNTNLMAYRIKPYQVNYYAKNQWAETPSEMFHSLLVRAFQKTHLFQAVFSPPYLAKYDYVLNTEIIELQHDMIRQSLRFRVAVRLNKFSTQKIIGSRVFTVDVPVKENTPYASVIAANQAEAIMLRKIIKFCSQTIH